MNPPSTQRKAAGRAKRTTSAQRLAQQKADFTAEGSPPPAKASSEVPPQERPRSRQRKTTP
jgi:hypothetical protein